MLSSPTTALSGSLQALKSKAGAKIADAIQQAASKTGVDFSYLLQQAQVESSFKADAKSSSSSATGLYQFIDSTWISMINKYGDKYGLSDYADKISDNGKVADKQTKSEILNLRNNPEICSLMAGEFAAENKSYLESCVKGDVGSTELYMAHFMGAGGAAKFLNALHKDPTASAADAFPQAASANKNVFYTKAGKEKSLAEVYAFFDNKFQIESEPTVACAATTSPAASANSNTANSVAAADATASSLYSHAFDENTHRWMRTRSDTSAPLASTWTPTDNLGGITGLTSNFISPVDVLDLLHNRSDEHSRFNS